MYVIFMVLIMEHEYLCRLQYCNSVHSVLIFNECIIHGVTILFMLNGNFCCCKPVRK